MSKKQYTPEQIEKNEAKKKLKSASTKDFVLGCIHALRTPPYQGIHAVFSGFNDMFRVKFPELDARTETAKLAEAGIIRIVPVKRGVMLFDASEAKPTALKKPSRNVSALLAKLPKELR